VNPIRWRLIENRVMLPLDVGFADHLPRVNADRVQLEQVLLNSITNAIDAIGATIDRGC
jgi:C4-dicarboxylate-specific signal transduction histidine kinase